MSEISRLVGEHPDLSDLLIWARLPWMPPG